MSMEHWIYHNPKFECDEYNGALLEYAPWSGLRIFAYDLISFLRPARIVELGSHYGCSSFAILQAIKDNKISSDFFAIDTWEGDSYTPYADTEHVYEMFDAVRAKIFGSQNVFMMRTLFEKAIDSFDDESIDLLHIDGSHKYEDVRADYESWYRKVSKDGIIMMHDIGADLVDGEEMGSHQFWKELMDAGAYSIELPISCGLGIVCKKRKKRDLLKGKFSFKHYQELENLQHTKTRDSVRKYYFESVNREKYIDDLKNQVEILQNHIGRYEADTQEKDKYIGQLETYKTSAEYSEVLRAENEQLKKQIINYTKTVENKDIYIRELQQQIEELNQFADSKDEYSRELETVIEKNKQFSAEKEKYIVELEQQLKSLDSFASDKEQYITGLKKNIEELNNYSKSKEDYIKKLQSDIRELTELLGLKESYIKELRMQIAELNCLVEKKEHYITELINEKQTNEIFAKEKEEYIEELEADRDSLNKLLLSKETYIKELLGQISDLNIFADGKERYIQELLSTYTDEKEE